MKTNFLRLGLVLMLASGCDGSTEVDAGVDAGMDAGAVPMDAGARDAGMVDRCAADTNVGLTVGCNGPLIGPDEPANEFAGLCTGDNEGPGTCSFTGAICWAYPGQVGVCTRLCTPSEDTYVSTGGCPSGSRCFVIEEDFALCFPDCEEDADCSTDSCDSENTCVDPPPVDAGMPDAGPDAGPIDAGPNDAGAVDAGPVDAGPVDAGPFDAGTPDAGVDAGPL
jgi:hypothetical protein